MIAAEKETKIEYVVNYRSNGVPTNPPIRKGRHACFLSQIDGESDARNEAIASAEACRKWFNEKKSVEMIEGREHFTTAYKDVVEVWVDEYHDGVLFQKGEIIPRQIFDDSQKPALGEGSYIRLLQEVMVEDYHFEKDAAVALVRKYSALVMDGIMTGTSIKSIRETALKIQEAQEEELRCEEPSEDTETEQPTTSTGSKSAGKGSRKRSPTSPLETVQG